MIRFLIIFILNIYCINNAFTLNKHKEVRTKYDKKQIALLQESNLDPVPNKIPKVSSGNALVKMTTYFGPVYIELYEKADPVTVNHFLKYVQTKFYDSIIFHRIIDGFVIQAGNYKTDFSEKDKLAAADTIPFQKNGLKNSLGTISMARKASSPNSASTQFFINLADNSNLDTTSKTEGYVVFGKIAQGIEIIKKIARIKIGQREGLHFVPFYPDEAEIKTLEVVSR